MGASKLICSKLTEKVIGCALKVHRTLGPGFLEKFYEEALCIELNRANLSFDRQPNVYINYQGHYIGHHRLDLIIENMVVVELKAIKEFENIHLAITLSYLKASSLPVALLVNFGTPSLSIKRFANTIFKFNAETPINRGSADEVINPLNSGPK